MFHYVYRIENIINGKIYVGKYSTKDLDDGYMGSGKLLNLAIKKHGIDNFRKHIIQMCESEREALDIERQIVDEEFVLDENTYNLTKGGSSWFAANKEGRANIRASNLWKDPSYSERQRSFLIEMNKRIYAEGKIKPPTFAGLHHKEESIRKIGQANSIHQCGEKNSQFGTMWICHTGLKKSQKIKKDELEPFLKQGWIKGRKIKWK